MSLGVPEITLDYYLFCLEGCVLLVLCGFETQGSSANSVNHLVGDENLTKLWIVCQNASSLKSQENRRKKWNCFKRCFYNIVLYHINLIYIYISTHLCLYFYS